jgi:hypothetical protein
MADFQTQIASIVAEVSAREISQANLIFAVCGTPITSKCASPI